MCALQEKLKNIITNDKQLLAHNKKWENCDLTNFHTKLNVSISERKNITCTNASNTNYKYIEYTKWGNKPTCVAIGFNPATHHPDEIDTTNNKIIDELNNKGYGGYVLLNLYPQVSSTKATFDESDEEDKKFQNTLLKLINTLIKKRIDTIIFWGRTVSIDKDVLEKLQELQKNNNLFITTKKDTLMHYHPARVSIEIKKVEKSTFFETSYRIDEIK